MKEHDHKDDPEIKAVMEETQKKMNEIVDLIGPINAMFILSQSIHSLALLAHEAKQELSAASYALMEAALFGMADGLHNHLQWAPGGEGVIKIDHDAKTN